MVRLFLKAISAIAFVGAVIWFCIKPDFEPAITALGALGTLVGLFIQERSSTHPVLSAAEADKEYTVERYSDGSNEIHVVSGRLTVNTLSWGTSVWLPPFKEPPDIILSREGATDEDAPEVVTKTRDGFSVRIRSTEQAGEWEWRARGVLLSNSSHK